MLQSLKFSREINLLLVSVLLFSTAIGIDLVTFPTILTINKIDPAAIGFASTCELFGGIIASFYLSRFIGKFGMLRGLGIAVFCYSSSILVIYFYHSFFFWIALALFMGCCRFIYVISCQAWLNISSNNEQRGVVTGIFSMAVSFGIAVGPAIVRIFGAASYFSFVVSALFVIASYLCLINLRNITQPKIESERIPLKDFFKRDSNCFLARFFLDFQSFALMSLTVIYGKKIGLSYEAAGLLITSYMSSGFFDVWVGFAIKKINPRKMINIGFLGSVFCFIVIILYHKSYPLLLILYFFLGISFACIYVSTYKIANEDYPAESLVAANATFQLIGSLGSICGVLFGGIMINIFDASGFPMTIILGCICYLTFLVIYEKKNTLRS